MSRRGTCKHAYQIQEMWQMPARPQPHEPAETHITLPDEYACQWLDAAAPLPPPIARQNGGFIVNRTDCDDCQCYEVVQVTVIPGAK